jgi:hypothetical protein
MSKDSKPVNFREASKQVRDLAKQGAFSKKPRLKIGACKLNELKVTESTQLWSDKEWVEYGLKTWDLVLKVKNGEIMGDWDMVRFKAEEHFRAGSFRDMIPIWTLAMPYVRKRIEQRFITQCITELTFSTI